MAGRGCACDGSFVCLCCAVLSSRHRGKEMQWGGKAEERSWDVILCFCCSHSLLQSGGRLASIISAVSLSLFFPPLSLSLVRSLARSLSALHTRTVLWRLIQRTLPLPYFFLWFVTVRILITATCCRSSQLKLTIALNLFICFLSAQLLHICMFVYICNLLPLLVCNNPSIASK